MEIKTLAHTPLLVSLIRKRRPTLLLTSLPLSLTISRHWRLEAPWQRSRGPHAPQ